MDNESAKAKGKRYFEYLLALLLVAAIVLVFFQRIDQISAATEKTSLQQSLSTLRMGKQLALFKRIIDGDESDIRALAGTNPVALLQAPPSNYAGEYEDGAAAGEVPAGQWYYDRSTGMLVYRVVHERLAVQLGGSTLRYRLNYQSRDESDRPRLHLVAVPDRK